MFEDHVDAFVDTVKASGVQPKYSGVTLSNENIEGILSALSGSDQGDGHVYWPGLKSLEVG